MPTKIPNEIVEKRIKLLEQEISTYEKYENEMQKRILKDDLRKLKEIKKSENFDEPKIPKKRGPKKKPITPARVAKFKLRRIKANARERSRMHGLNEALELLRDKMPKFNMAQKLSKIETLRLAYNYIGALGDILNENQVPDNKIFAEKLCCGLSQNTMNLIANALDVNPRTMNYTDIMNDYNLNDSLVDSSFSDLNTKNNPEIITSPGSSIKSEYSTYSNIQQTSLQQPHLQQNTKNSFNSFASINHNFDNYQFYNQQNHFNSNQQINKVEQFYSSSNNSTTSSINSPCSDFEFEDITSNNFQPPSINDFSHFNNYYNNFSSIHYKNYSYQLH